MAWETWVFRRPDRHDRCLDELVDAVGERDEVPLAHVAACAAARPVNAQTVAQPGARAWPYRDQPGH